MNHLLPHADRERLDRLIAESERRTGAEIVLAVIRRCDLYPEIPWKAFALGASVTGLVIFVVYASTLFWISAAIVLLAVAAVLAGGSVLALLAMLEPRFARLFLSRHRAKEEVRQYAESLFLSRELFHTAERKGVLLLVGLFERQVLLLPDKGVRDRLNGHATQRVIRPMTELLRANEVGRAMEEGLAQITRILEPGVSETPADAGANELPNTIIEEEGV